VFQELDPKLLAFLEASMARPNMPPRSSIAATTKKPVGQQRLLTADEALALSAYATSVAPAGTPGRQEARDFLKSSPVPQTVMERLINIGPDRANDWYVSRPGFLDELDAGRFNEKLGIQAGPRIQPTEELWPDPRPYSALLNRTGDWLGFSPEDTERLEKALDLTPVGAFGEALDSSAMGDPWGTALNSLGVSLPGEALLFKPEVNAALSLLPIARAGSRRGACQPHG
jgi:hypothetical protein